MKVDSFGMPGGASSKSVRAGRRARHGSAATRGVTLIEAMIVLALVAILAALAAPNFSDLMARNRIRSATSDLMSAFSLARSEAVYRKTNVAVCFRSSIASGWEVVNIGDGWTCPAAQPTSVVMRSYEGVSGITGTISGVADVVFLRDGRLATTDGMALTLETDASKSRRKIRVTSLGRVQVTCPDRGTPPDCM